MKSILAQIYVYFCLLLLVLIAVDGTFPVVKGGKDFCHQVKRALTLLEQKAPDYLTFINEFVKVIQVANTSGMCIFCKPPTYQLSPQPANLEKYWLASTIAHESYHAYLYALNKYNLKGAEPEYDSYSGFEAERKCNVFQLQVLQKIDAPAPVIDWMKQQDGKHCDVNRDGKCDTADYKIRQVELKGKS